MLLSQALLLLIHLLINIVNANNDCYSKDVKLIALHNGSFRVFINTDAVRISSFAFHANINRPIYISNKDDLYGEQIKSINGKWFLDFNTQLKIGDIVNYKVYVDMDHLSCRIARLSWIVTELKDSFNCITSATAFDGRTTFCSEELIFMDDFNGSSIDTTKWIAEQKIQTYSGPTYEFNFYENQENTLFLKNNKLYIKPITITDDSEVRGVLDLRQGCTSNVEDECYYASNSFILLPPVKSAMIKSNFSFKYGKLEIKAKLPSGDWIFPVLQLKQRKRVDGKYKDIWIAYSRGNDRLIGPKGDDIGSRVLYGGIVVYSERPPRNETLVNRVSKNSYSDNFHVYVMEWTPGKISFFVDSEFYGSVQEHLFPDEFELSLGVGVGGFSDFPDDYVSDHNHKPWDNLGIKSVKNFFYSKETWLNTWKGDNPALQVDYVKIWAI